MIEVAQVSLDQDLGPFLEWLNRQGVASRVVESDGKQALVILNAEYKGKVLEALDAYCASPEIQARLRDDISAMPGLQRRAKAAPYDRVSPQQAPLVFVVMFLCVAVAWLTDMGQGGPVLRQLLIVNPFDVAVNMGSVSGRWEAFVATIALGDYWRIITPDFLHFSVLHITFNLLMFWVLGGQVEYRKGWWPLLSLILIVSVVSNVAQLLDGGYLFGGLSGVVYGLFGYCWVWTRYDSRVFMPDALFKFALVWLIVGYTPLTQWLGLGSMANSAHLYGLLTGLIWAWFVFGFVEKKSR